MRSLRRTWVLGLTAFVVTGVIAAGPAGADSPEVYAAQATGSALQLNVLGNSLTFGQSVAHVQSTLLAEATGAGQLLNPATSTAAKVTRDGGHDAQALRCATPTLPAQLTAVLNLGAACSQANADIHAAAPHAYSEGTVARVDLSANNVLKPVTDKVQIGQTLGQVLSPVVSAVDKATGSTAAIDATTTVTNLLQALTTTQTLSVTLGKSTAETATLAKSVTSTSTDEGGTVSLLPVAALGGTPLVQVVVGSARAAVTYDRTTGKATPAADPALVTVKVGALGSLPATSETVAPGTSKTLFTGTPLETTIAVASGRSFTDAQGVLHAVADGVSIQVAKGLPNVALPGLTSAGTGATGGISLQLAHAEALGGGRPAVVTPAAPQATRTLPRTGPSLPWLPVAGAGLATAALFTRRYLLTKQSDA